jgi:serine/threonine protein phosphatase PrpC
MLLKRRSAPKAAQSGPVAVTGTMLTHPGCVREINEDVVAYVLPADAGCGNRHGMIALVADGMGGHAAGEVASRMAADTVLRLYHQIEGCLPDVLAQCFAKANRVIFERSQTDAGCAGMGTTCTVLATSNGMAFLAHIGDSRAYLLRDDRLKQISEDHSLVAQLVREGRLTKEEAAHSPERNVILRALGTEPSIEVSISRGGIPLRAGDVFVLCSDGLSDLVDDQVIAETIARLAPFEACQALVEAALAAGGTDNVSVGVFVADHSQQRRSEAPRATRPVELPGGAP